ncbi:hypothetical protein HK414_21245 [Ramlibacter terrae]|uniref:Uncharacterized protein n=1 Tax=Ramlibacter terrae TaxID=2732511 RepID=A0ABX6P4V3_9BURK|nr:hypothetical protein HK414_21245 [Ramlibacter terrae]
MNKSKWTSFSGFFRGYEALDDARKWRFYTYIFDEQVPPPRETVRRCDAHAGFTLRLASPWLDVHPSPDGVDVTTPSGTERFDAVIFGTGFDVDLLDRPELARYLPHIDTGRGTWRPSRRRRTRNPRASRTSAPASNCARVPESTRRRCRACTCSTGAAR